MPEPQTDVSTLRWILAGTVFVFLAYLGSKFVSEVLLNR